MDFDLVISHHPCPDGLCGSWVFWTLAGKPKDPNGNYPKFWGAKHDSDGPIPDVTGLNVLFVDFAYPRAITEKMLQVAKFITILDHHKTTNDLLPLTCRPNFKLVLDMSLSGAQLAWNYVHPAIPRPFFIDYIADRDLWTWKLPQAKEVTRAFFGLGYYENFDTFDKIGEHSFDYYATAGRILLETDEVSMKFLLRQARTVIMKCPSRDYTVALLGCEAMRISEVGSRLAEERLSDGKFKYDFAALWRHDYSENKWWLSLRGAKESPIDLSAVAQEFGGGGHAKAAGFTLPQGMTLQDMFHKIG